MTKPYPKRWRTLKALLDADRPPPHPGLYVEPQRGCARQVVNELKGNADGVKFLLLGPRGGGKSTELRRIWAGVRDRMTVAEVDLDRSGILASRVSALDLCYLGGLAFLRHLPEDDAAKLFGRLKKAYVEGTDSDPDALGTLAEALGGLAGFAEGAFALAAAAGLATGAVPVVGGALGLVAAGIRLFTRPGAVPETARVGRTMLALLEEIAAKVREHNDRRPLCLFVDGLEKMNGESVERFRELFQRTRLLADAPWSAVLAAPPCTLTETFSTEGQGWTERVVWGFGPDDLDGLVQALTLRFRKARVEPADHLPLDAIARWAAKSGGMPRHAVEMANRAVELARQSGGSVITEEMVAASILLKAQSLARGLGEGHFRVLGIVHGTGRLPDDPKSADLFADGRILALPPLDGVPRFRVHPLLESALSEDVRPQK